MVTVSHNEIVVACRKAFEALGFGLGQAEDGANALGWLASHGLAWPGKLSDRIETLRPTDQLPSVTVQIAENSAWDANGASALSCFPMLADYASVRAEQNQAHHLTISSMGDIDLLWPYLITLPKRGFNAFLSWHVSEGVVCQAHFDVTSKYPELRWLADASLHADEIQLTVSQNSLARSNRDNPNVIRIETGEDFQQSYLSHTKDGIPMDAALWLTLNKIGKGLLVESTAESEKRGAGGE